jgi:TolB-like protein
MTDDEAFTVKTLKEYRAVMSDLIGQHTGRVVDDPGDNLLAEFASVVNAVRCAVEIQKVLKENNEKLPTEKRLEFRIGVNIGDVIQDQDRIYGEGVNIAARIEGLAEPGGVCISRNAYNHVRNKLNFGYEYLGEHDVKNIKVPVRVYKLLMAPEDAGKLIGDVPKSEAKNWKWAAVVVALIIIASIVWLISKEKPAKAEIPSIAVLPFVNMSNDPEQEYFIDGMTDELINDLTKIKNLFVISRNSTFTYKGKSIKVQQIANDLNVRYILEGSVQRSGDNVRIRAQLIDGKTDHHLWSESYDGVMDDIFELQDKITGKIVSALAVKLSAPELNIISDKGTKNPLAHEAYLKGQAHLRLWTPDDLVAAIDLFERALDLDPEFSQVYTALATAYLNNNMGGREYYAKTGKEYFESKILMRHYINLSMENPTPNTYAILAFLELQRRNFDQAILYANKALILAPNDADILRAIGLILALTGHMRKQLIALKTASQMCPISKL